MHTFQKTIEVLRTLVHKAIYFKIPTGLIPRWRVTIEKSLQILYVY